MREAVVKRETKETKIELHLNLDKPKCEINTGIGFFDHMLEILALHGGFGIKLIVLGDLNVDCHHTVEDIGIVLGKAFNEALNDKSGIERYGSFYAPMDEALAFVALDISGRPYLAFDAVFDDERVGSFDTCMTVEFLRAFAFNSGITLHTKVLYGSNSHHKIEAIFKALAHALKIAIAQNNGGALSTKGSL